MMLTFRGLYQSSLLGQSRSKWLMSGESAESVAAAAEISANGANKIKNVHSESALDAAKQRAAGSIAPTARQSPAGLYQVEARETRGGPQLMSATACASWQSAQTKPTHEGDEDERNLRPSLRVGCVLPCPPRDAFRIIMDVRNLGDWSQLTNVAEIVAEEDSHCDVVHYHLNPLWVGNMWTSPRDMLLKRYWVCQEDGSYIISWQSVADDEIPSPQGHIRATVYASTMILLPQKGCEDAESPTCYIEYACHADPGGWITSKFLSTMCCNNVRNMARLWLTEYMLQIIGIREMIERSRYVDAALSEETTGENAMLALERGSSSRRKKSIRPHLSELRLGSMNEQQWLATPEESAFKVRGPHYLKDKIKYMCTSHMFNLVAVDLFVVKQKVSHIAARSDNVAHKLNEMDDKLFNVLRILKFRAKRSTLACSTSRPSLGSSTTVRL